MRRRELYMMNEMCVYSRMYFVSMSGECDVWVGEKGEVKRIDGVRGLKESE